MAKQSGLKGFEKVMAIKRILPHLTEDKEFVSMFINEAKLAALLSHQNIVQIFDLGHIENSYFIAMEYVMGKDLRTILQRARALNLPLSVGHALLIVAQVCAGLDYVHRKKDLTGRDLNLVHRDISPQNILISYEGEVKVVDFGIAKAATQSSETRTGVLKGKLSYMAPEQAWGKAIDRRADIFAIGIVLYEILTGRKLFKGDNDFNTLEKVREAKVEPAPAALNQQVTPELEQIILKALAKDPENRFGSASELQTAIEDHMSQKGYDFSTARLSHYLKNLFQFDIEQDTQRFQVAMGASSGTTDPVDQSTVVRPHSLVPDPAPSNPSRRIPTPASGTRSARSKTAQTSKTGVGVMTLMILFGGATWVSIVDPPFFRSLKQSHPPVRAAAERLAAWPQRGMDWLQSFQGGPEIEPGPMETALLDPNPVPIPDSDLSQEMNHPELNFREELSPADASAHRPAPFEPPPRKPSAADRERATALLREAKEAYGKGNLEEVEQTLRKIIDLNPNIPVTYHLLGTVNLERNDTDRALRIFEEATRKFPNYALLHYDLGFLYFKQGVVSMAREELLKGLALNPQDAAAERARRVLGQIDGAAVVLPGHSVRESEASP